MRYYVRFARIALHRWQHDTLISEISTTSFFTIYCGFFQIFIPHQNLHSIFAYFIPHHNRCQMFQILEPSSLYHLNIRNPRQLLFQILLYILSRIPKDSKIFLPV